MNGSEEQPKTIRDLSDFCAQWGSLRKLVEEDVMKEAGLSAESQEVLTWMRLLTEKVCALEE